MRPRLVLLPALALLAFASAASALTIERELRFDASRLSVTSSSKGEVALEARGGTHEFVAGRPDLPWLSERVDLPAGMKVTQVEVLSAETELLRDAVRIAPAPVTRPGAGPLERTAADASFYSRAGFQPEQIASLGMQGSLRGRNVAYLRVAPARWDAQTGRLERITRLRVRLTVEDGAAPAVPRERIVREWEDEMPSGVPSRAVVSLESAATTGSPGNGRKAEPFKPLQIPSVVGSPVEYVIVTTDAMAPAFQQLADWKTQAGVPAVVRTMSFIRQQYPFGADDAERIRTFIRDAYSRWGTKWVLLGGDTDVIPERLAFNVSFYQQEHIAADIYYSCLDGNWNADGNSEYGEGFQDSFLVGDEADLMPEVYVGRATVSTIGEAQTFVNKTLTYTRTPASGYADRWLLFAEVLFPQPYNGGTIDLDGAQLAEDILPLTDLNPGISVKRLYENYTDPTFRPGALNENRASVTAELNLGYGLALHVGHGYRNSMSVADASLVNGDASALTNGNKMFNLYAIDCTSSAIDFPCIGEAFLKNPNGGAVSVVGSTRFDFPTAGRAYQQEYFRLFFEDSVAAVGELQARQKLPFLAFSFYDGVNRWTQLTLLMLGDPELRMYNGAWRSLAMTAPGSFALGDSVMSVHVTSSGNPVANARVTAFKAGDEFRSALTNAAGDVALPFRPDSTGSFTLTVTAYNAKPLQSVLNVTAAAAAAVGEAAMTVDDDNLGGTSGNGDGIADAGETVDLRVALRNRGGAGSSGVVLATLSTTDAFVSVTNSDATYAPIAAGATGNPLSPFRVSIPANIPDQREVPFSLILWDSARSWREALQLTVRAPELVPYEHVVTESPGNNDGRPTTGETATYIPKVRNNGSGIGKNVTAKLRCLNGLATVTDSTSTLGDVAAGATVAGDGFTFNVTGAGAKFQLEVSDGSLVRYLRQVDLTFPNAPGDLAAIGEADAVKLTWNTNAVFSGGTCQFGPSTCNFSLASASVKAMLALLTPGDVVNDGGNYFPFGTKVVSYNPGTFVLTLDQPSEAASLQGSVVLYIQSTDVAGYNIYRSTSQAGPFTRANAVPTERTAYFHDENLPPLTKFWYRITSVDSSANESAFFETIGINTNPPTHSIFPVPTAHTTPSSVAVEFAYSSQNATMAVGSDLLYVLNADGSAPVDADGQGTTIGDFSMRGESYFAAGPSMSVLGPAEGMSFIAPCWGVESSPPDSAGLYVFNSDGQLRPGFPLLTSDPIWGSAVVTDLNNDGHMEIAVGSNGTRFYVMRENGLEWMNGDANPATKGVFKVLGGAFNIGTPAAANMDGDAFPELIFGSIDGKLYVWNGDGSNVPGFPFTTLSAITSSPAVAYLDGPGDVSPEIIFSTTNDSLYVLNSNGALRAGWPVWTRTGGSSRSPSPAIADMNNDGFPDIVHLATNGGIYVFNRNGSLVFPWSNVRYTTHTSGASESSPVVADINGDGFNDIICGGEEGQLVAMSGATATMLPGFPILLAGEVRGTPAVADIDKDGKSEIMLAGWDKNLYVWDYDFPFSPGQTPPWPQFHHDARRTGFASAPLFVGVGDEPGDGPQGNVAQLEFGLPMPNPTRPGAGTRFHFAIPATHAGATYELDIYDLSGRRVQRVDSGIAQAGRFSLQWNLRNAAGRPVEGGVYFARLTVGGKSLQQKFVVLQ
jgi:hypothetical protein